MPNVASMTALYPSFIPGSRLIDGGELQALANSIQSAASGITAAAGGTQAAATVLSAAVNQVDTCASDNDSVVLPQAIPGRAIIINNATANTLAVFGLATNGVTGVGDRMVAHNSNSIIATATGTTQATTLVAIYVCFVAGIWKQILGA